MWGKLLRNKFSIFGNNKEKTGLFSIKDFFIRNSIYTKGQAVNRKGVFRVFHLIPKGELWEEKGGGGFLLPVKKEKGGGV